MNPLYVHLDRLRRRWWLVAIITVLGVVVAGALAWSQPTLYMGKAALTTSSQNRSPDQDASLAEGYAQYFNEPSYQALIGAQAKVPAGVTFSARTAAASPILYIEAVSTDRQTASDSATTLAVTFRDAVRGQLGRNKDQLRADIQKQIDDANDLLTTIPQSDERVIVLQQLFELQSRANDVQSDDSNQLKDLALDAGVSTSKPDLPLNLLLGLLAGAVLGSVAALALAGLENRISSPREARELLGLPTLGDADDHIRSVPLDQQLKSLANMVALPKGRSVRLAVTTPRASQLSGQVAEGLAVLRAAQGVKALLVQADLHRTSGFAPGGRGVAEFLASSGTEPVAAFTATAGQTSLAVVPAGHSDLDPYVLFSHDNFHRLLDGVMEQANLVVIEAPAVLDTAEAQVICATVDRTILVLEEGVSRATDASRAVALLKQVGADVLGVVVARAERRPDGEPRLRVQSSTSAGPDAQWEHEPAASAATPTSWGSTSGGLAATTDEHPGLRPAQPPQSVHQVPSEPDSANSAAANGARPTPDTSESR